MRSVALATALSLVFSCTGCATMISGTYQDVDLAIEPRDATVEVTRWNGLDVIRPASASDDSMKLHRPEWEQSYVIVAKRDGHCPKYWLTGTEMSNGAHSVWPMLVAAALIPISIVVTIPILLIDSSSGGSWAISPDPLAARLQEDEVCL